jgi:NAD(P)-dependent dehydrogenase (short-subunit alcohol dehydrogenase family)
LDLNHQVALVTGGTAGIGLETARLLADDGADVIITGRNAENGKAALNALGDCRSVRFVQTDLADLVSVNHLINQTGPVDVIVNNAGAFPFAPTVAQDSLSYDRIFDTNVRGPFYLVANFIPYMLQRDPGAPSASIVNVSSLTTAKGLPCASVYSASKAALESLTRSWAVEFAPAVRVNAVAPGPTRTEGVLHEWGEKVEDFGRATALGRTARATEIAEVIAFLASPRASYVTGAIVRADAGASVC